MIICPKCSSVEMEGSFFCHECGAQLITGGTLSVPKVNNTNGIDTEENEEPPARQRISPPTPYPKAYVTMHFLGKGVFLPIDEAGDFIIGRKSPGQTMVPDIDLNLHQAFEAGVSRLHAMIRVDNGQITIIDLNSSNGTTVNGVRLEPNVPHMITHGDVISLGKFKIEVITNKKLG